jgi:hypothetical protein
MRRSVLPAGKIPPGVVGCSLDCDAVSVAQPATTRARHAITFANRRTGIQCRINSGTFPHGPELERYAKLRRPHAETNAIEAG